MCQKAVKNNPSKIIIMISIIATSEQLVHQVSQRERGLRLNHEAFIIYVRTVQFLKTRLRGIEDAAVYIPVDEVVTRFFPFPKFAYKHELQKLVETEHLKINEVISPKTGNKMFTYEARQPGTVDLYLIKPKAGKYDPVVLQMITYLKLVSLNAGAPELPPYFESFLQFRVDCMNLFVTVDDFAGRVYTPITNLHRPIRPHLLIEGQPTTGIDVVTMQPLLLGKILKQEIGNNEFSNWLDSGQDIYTVLQQKVGLDTREDGKKRFFEILFSRPNYDLAEVFGDAPWITWINQYKRQPEPRNPHTTAKPHSNLAWLLQTTEVAVMRKVWQNLIHAGIPFLSVHDEVIVKQSDSREAEGIFRSVLDQEFVFYKLNGKQAITGVQTAEQQVILSQSESVTQACPVQVKPTPASTQFLSPQSHQDVKHDYLGADGILYIHWPGLPEIC